MTDAYAQGKQRIVDFDVALCAHVLNDTSHRALVVHDVTQDLKMRKNPVWNELADDPIEVSSCGDVQYSEAYRIFASFMRECR